MGTDGDFESLSDLALASLARDARRQACQGHRDAFGRAHALEKELRRRGLTESIASALQPLRDDTTLAVLLAPERRPWWRFWQSRDGLK